MLKIHCACLYWVSCWWELCRKLKLRLWTFLIPRSRFLSPFGKISNPILSPWLTRARTHVMAPVPGELSTGPEPPCTVLIHPSLSAPHTALCRLLVGAMPRWGDSSLKLPPTFSNLLRMWLYFNVFYLFFQKGWLKYVTSALNSLPGGKPATWIQLQRSNIP